MVETVSASTLPQGTGNGSAARTLEPGTEIKARVESNLPGGVVRLATADGKVDLRVASPLPANAEVTVTVSGSKQQPEILITTDKAPAQTGQQSGGTVQGQGGQQAQPNPSLANPSQSNSVRPDLPRTGETASAFPAQSTAARPIVTATPAGAHLVQVMPATVRGPATGAPTSQLATAPGTQPSAGAGGAAAPAPLSGQAAVPGTAQPPQAGVPQPGVPAPNASADTGSLQAPVASSSQAPAQASASPGQLPGGGTVTGTPVGQGASSGTQPIVPSNTPAGQQAPPVSGNSSAAVPSGTGALSASSVAVSTTGPAGTAAGGPPAQVSATPAGQAAATPLPGTAPQPGGQAVSASSAQTGVTAGQGSPNAPAAGQPSGEQVVLGARPGQQGAPAQLRPGTGFPQPQPAAQAASGQTTAAGPGQAGAHLSGQATPSLAGTAPGVASTPAAQSAVLTAAPPAGAQTGVQTGAQGPALATLTAGTGGLGLQQGAAPVRILNGQPYQQLGSQPLGGAVPANPGTQVLAGKPEPAAQVAGALQKPLAEQQAGLTSLFAQVGSLMSAQGAGNVALPDAVVKAMQQILGLRLNLSGGASAGDLQQAVSQSGQFREAQLALPGSGTGAVPDLKSALLSFKSLLQQMGARPEITRPAGQPAAPSRHAAPQGQAQQAASGYWAGAAPQNLQALLKETDAALARLRLTQLSNTGLARDSAPQATAKPMDLVLELPLAIGQETAVMQMQIGRDGAGNQTGDEAEPAWRLRFALDLTATGPLEAAISLRGGGTYASLWVDRKDTFDNLNAVRETMEAAFADAGLDLQELRLIRGLPPRTAAYYGNRIDRQS